MINFKIFFVQFELTTTVQIPEVKCGVLIDELDVNKHSVLK